MGCCRPGNTEVQPLFLLTPKSCFRHNFLSLLCHYHLLTPSAPCPGGVLKSSLALPLHESLAHISDRSCGSGQWTPCLGAGFPSGTYPTVPATSKNLQPQVHCSNPHSPPRQDLLPTKSGSSATLVTTLIRVPSPPALFTTWTLPTQRFPGTDDPAPLS